MKHYVVSIPQGVFAIPYQPLTENTRVEGSGWATEEWTDEDAEWQVKDDIVQYLCDNLGLDLFDPTDVHVLDSAPNDSTLIQM